MELSYDDLKKVTGKSDPDGALGARSTYQYDLLGNLTSFTDPNGNTRKVTYDSLSRKTMESDPLGNKTTYEYDPVGNLTKFRPTFIRAYSFEQRNKVFL